jgi:multidrug efflux pump subunit AcrA (membrane-fusion protein)
MNTRRDRPSRPWLLYALGVVAIVVAALAVSEIGPPTSSARSSKEVVTAEQGVVQSTVTGSGNVAAGTDVTVNFNTSGTLQDVYVKVGQHVNGGQLLADLDPTSANLTLSQAESSLTAAQDQLNCLEGQTSDCGSGGSGSGSGSSSSGSTSSTSLTGSLGGTVEFASFQPGRSDKTKKPKSGSGGSGGTTTTITKTTTKTVTTIGPGSSRTTTSTTPSSSGRGSGSGSGSSARGSGDSGGSGGSGGSKSANTTTTTTTPSPGSIASAQAAVYSAEATVHNAETGINDTKLYAPTSGTIASLSSLTPGDAVSGGGSGSSSSSSSSSTSSGSGAASTGGAATAGSLGGSSSSSTSSSGFAEIVNTDTLTMTVAFSESDISQVKVGQPATVTLDALPGVELAAHISSISLVGTTSSSVVSYDAVLTLDQNDSRVRPGMSASASVITGQASGVTVPNAAVTGSGSVGTVNLMKDGKEVSRQVVIGLRGDSRTQIISGVSGGDQLVITIALPSLSSTSTTGGSGTGSGTLGGGGLGGLGGLGGGGGGFFRGGGGGAALRGGGGGG